MIRVSSFLPQSNNHILITYLWFLSLKKLSVKELENIFYLNSWSGPFKHNKPRKYVILIEIPHV